jgi:hypothetical protein
MAHRPNHSFSVNTFPQLCSSCYLAGKEFALHLLSNKVTTKTRETEIKLEEALNCHAIKKRFSFFRPSLIFRRWQHFLRVLTVFKVYREGLPGINPTTIQKASKLPSLRRRGTKTLSIQKIKNEMKNSNGNPFACFASFFPRFTH